DAQELQGILSQPVRRLYIPPETESTVERRSERDRGLVTDRRVHADAAVNDPSDGLGLGLRVAGIQHDEPNIIFEHLEEFDEGLLADRLRLPALPHQDEPGLLAAASGSKMPDGLGAARRWAAVRTTLGAMPAEVHHVRPMLEQQLLQVAGPHGPCG